MAVLKDRTRLTGLLADTAARSTALRAAVFFGQATPETLLEPLEVALRQMAGRIFLGKVMNKQEVWTKPDLRFECLKLLLIPIVPDVLYVVVVLQQINELLHVLDVVLIFQLDIVLRHHLHGVAPDRVYSDGRLARRRVSSYLTFPP